MHVLCILKLSTHQGSSCIVAFNTLAPSDGVSRIVFHFHMQPSRCVNQIEDVCKDIEKTINQTVQNTLNTLERDCNRISQLIEERIQKDR